MRPALPLPLERLRARAAARLGLLALVVPFALAGACRVEATVETVVEGRGGVVTARFELDREAVTILGGDAGADDVHRVLVEGAQVGDLRRAGWTVGPPQRTKGGGVRAEISKRFERPEDLAAVIGELSGLEGPLQDFRLVRSRRFTSTRYRLSGAADLRGGPGATGFGNAAGLAERLEEAGVDPGRVEELLTSRAAEGFGLRMVADLPGGSRSVVAEVPLGERVELVATARTAERVRPVLLALAVVLIGSALVLVRRPSGVSHS